MKRTKVEGQDWTSLANAIEDSACGDVIEVENWHAAQMGHSAAFRLRGPAHGILFECGGKRVDYLDADDPPAGSGFNHDGFPCAP